MKVIRSITKDQSGIVCWISFFQGLDISVRFMLNKIVLGLGIDIDKEHVSLYLSNFNLTVYFNSRWDEMIF